MSRALAAALPSPAPVAEDVRRGVVLMLASVLMFSALNVLVKTLAVRYPVNEVVFFRSFFSLIPAALMVAAGGGLASLRTAHPGQHVWRALTGGTSMGLIFLAFDLMPLADAVAISFAGPLFLTALAVPMLGERVGVHRWTAVVVGFGGVLLMVRPSGEVFNLGAAAAISSAFLYALAMISIRRMARTESATTIAFYFALICAAGSALTLPFAWVTPTWEDLGLFLLLGIVGGVAQYFMTASYRYAPAGVVTPFNYAAILFASAFGFLFWGEVPTPALWAGAAVVVASGLYILHRETRRRVEVVRRAPAPTPGAG